MVCRTEGRRQFLAVAFTDAFHFIGMVLQLSHGCGGSEACYVQVADAQLSQLDLQPVAVGKRVRATAHGTPLTDVAERIDAMCLQLCEELVFGRVVNADGEEVHWWCGSW